MVRQIVKQKQEITLPNVIQTVDDIVRLLINGEDNWLQYGRVACYPHPSNPDLRIFNYRNDAFRGKGWIQFEILARGLILNAVTGEIVGRSFDKFFNYGEYGVDFTPVGKIKNVYEKIDGNLGVLIRNNGVYEITTRGRFDSGAAIWATKFLNDNFDLTGLEEELTLIFEIVNPDIRVIVNYDGLEDIILLAARNRFTGKYVEVEELCEIASRYGFNIPAMYSLGSIEEVINASHKLDVNAEGYVVEYEDGSRWKIKGDEYRKISRMIINLNFRNTVRAFRENMFDSYIDLIPPEYMSYVDGWVRKIEDYKSDTLTYFNNILNSLPEEIREDEKRLALWVNSNYSKKSREANYLLAVSKGKDITRGLYSEMLELPNEFVQLTDV